MVVSCCVPASVAVACVHPLLLLQVTNHPEAGGTHLPDITVITPVFADTAAGRAPVFYVASRGHHAGLLFPSLRSFFLKWKHADIGGISAGSMPPFSKYLEEEGAAVESFFLVKDGVFQEAGISAILNATDAGPMRYSSAAKAIGVTILGVFGIADVARAQARAT